VEKGLSETYVDDSVLDPNSRTGAYYRKNKHLYTDGPVKPYRVLTAETEAAEALFAEDANGDRWWKPDGSLDGPWVIEERLKDRDPEQWANLHPDNKAEWNRENPDRRFP
jgi:hypothetical protein